MDDSTANVALPRLVVGVSSCLLGNAVRYDGRHKLNRFVREELSGYFEFEPYCPEVAIGMGVPRPPIRLMVRGGIVEALGVGYAGLNVTLSLRGYGREVACARLALTPGAPRPLTALRVLDIGCGGGILSEAMARLGAEVHGVDVVARNIAIAREHAQAGGLDIAYQTTSAEALAARGERYDLVLNMEVVEHVADLPGFFAACGALVRPGGLMFVATLNRTLRSLLFAKFAAEYLLRWLPRGTHQWSRFPCPREVEQLFRNAGMRVVAGTGVALNPLTRRFRLTPGEAMNYMRVGQQAADR